MSARVKPWHGGGQRGLHLWCPACDTVHGVTIDPAGWTWNGDLEKPTLSPSLLVNGRREHPTAPVCHSFVRDGRIEFLGDCSHALVGQTVDLPPWPMEIE